MRLPSFLLLLNTPARHFRTHTRVATHVRVLPLLLIPLLVLLLSMLLLVLLLLLLLLLVFTGYIASTGIGPAHLSLSASRTETIVTAPASPARAPSTAASRV